MSQQTSRRLYSRRLKNNIKGSLLIISSLFALFSLMKKEISSEKQIKAVPTAIGTFPATPSDDNLRMDYEQRNEQVRMLTDIRFKLLAFVPTLTAAAVALLTSATVAQGTVLVVGLLGFVVTLAL